MKVLVTGGAGYIGSHTVKALLAQGHDVVVYDNLSTGPSEGLHKGVRFHLGDVRDYTLLNRVVKDSKVQAVIHLAAKLNVQESLMDPLSFYENNIMGIHSVLKAMASNQVQDLIFSSSAAVYGEKIQNRSIIESDTTEPITPYGHTKLMCEQMIKDAAEAHNLRYCILRYFNVAGAAEDLGNGQRTQEAYHLIQLAAKAAAGKKAELQIYGTDFSTPDGTAVRDFIHIEDAADLHLLALQQISESIENSEFNCGYGRGYSVKQVVETMKKVSGVDFKVSYTKRKSNTPASLVANAKKLKDKLGWEPKRDSLELICKTAYEWEKRISG